MVGIVIDDAIVVLENVYRFIEEKGMTPFRAAIEGTREIGLAVMATTLSLLAVFVPVGFMGGIVGRFMSSFGLTSAFAIFVSLIVSFTVVPTLAARWIKKPAHGEAHVDSKESRFYRPIDRTYTWMLEFSMRHRGLVVLGCVLVTLSTVPLFMFVGKNFLPENDQAEFEVVVQAPEGSTLAATAQTVDRIARDIRAFPGVAATLVTVGGGQQERVNNASIYVKLTPVEERDIPQFELMGRARQLLTSYPPELRTAVQQVAAISGGGFKNADVQYVLGGPDLAKLTEYSAKLVAKLKTIPDAVDADTTLVTGKPEIRVRIDRAKAADLGVRASDIATAINTLVGGTDVTTFNEGSDQYEVVLRAAEQFRVSQDAIRRLTVPSSKLGTVGLEHVVKLEESTGPAAIDRINRQRQVTITANVKPGGSQSAILAELSEYVRSMNLGPEYSAGLAGRSKELGRAGFYFLLAIALSFIFMYIVLAAQFESFIHPVTILLTLPLAIPFGIISLLVTGQTVNIFSGLGLLLLFGVVKKNAILQIDHTNTLRGRGLSRYEAIIQANRDRLRPILMTTIALVAGMLPLVFGQGPGAATNRAIGVLVVGGQSLCLLLTLLAVPVFYSLFEDLGELRIWRRLRGALGAVGGGRRVASSRRESTQGGD
jgi:HAE1 family hydrophobic/amphiphilic exporter-1